MSNVFNLICVVLIAFGCVILVREQGRHTILRQEYDRLDQTFGSLEPTDRSKVLVKCIDTDAPEFFRWRVYLPPMSNCQVQTKTIGSLSSSPLDLDPQGTEMTFTLRYRNFDGEAKFYFVEQAGSSVITLPKSIRSFIAEHWEQLELEVLARDRVVEGKSEQVWTLFEIRIPTRLQDELPDRTRKLIGDGGSVLKIGFGQSSAFSNQGL